MFFGKKLNLHPAAEEALRCRLADMACIPTFAPQHQLIYRLHAYFNSHKLWLFKMYVIPAGMYASQIWTSQRRKLLRQKKLSLHQLRRRRNIGSEEP
eukprot:1144412-Pelagomonas_calceolata.AAC.1